MVGHDTAGLPVYSGNKVRYGNCSGALEVYYGWAPAYYQGLMTSPLEPLRVVTAEDGGKASAAILDEARARWPPPAAASTASTGADASSSTTTSSSAAASRSRSPPPRHQVHASLMAYHAKELTAAGFDPKAVAPPKAVVLGNWIADGKYTPGIGCAELRPEPRTLCSRQTFAWVCCALITRAGATSGQLALRPPLSRAAEGEGRSAQGGPPPRPGL